MNNQNKAMFGLRSPDTKVKHTEFKENNVHAVDIVDNTSDGKAKSLKLLN